MKASAARDGVRRVLVRQPEVRRETTSARAPRLLLQLRDARPRARRPRAQRADGSSGPAASSITRPLLRQEDRSFGIPPVCGFSGSPISAGSPGSGFFGFWFSGSECDDEKNPGTERSPGCYTVVLIHRKLRTWEAISNEIRVVCGAAVLLSGGVHRVGPAARAAKAETRRQKTERSRRAEARRSRPAANAKRPSSSRRRRRRKNSSTLRVTVVGPDDQSAPTQNFAELLRCPA